MRVFHLSVAAAVVYLSVCQSARAETTLIEGVYQDTLQVYSQEGRKLDKLENLNDEAIAGTPVLERTSRGLVKVRFQEREMWLRESALKLSVPTLPKCTGKAPGRASDRTTPTSSGMAAACKD